MPWTDRLLEAAYTPLNGSRLTFEYEDVSKAFDKRGTAFDFPDADGTYVQQTGNSGRRYPWRIFLSGPDHDQEADVFEAALLTRGVGVLEHPRYGVVDVVPFGVVTFRDNLKTAANQTVIEVTFWATVGLVFPASQDDPGSSVLSALDGFNSIFPVEFEEFTDLDSTSQRVSFRNGYETLLGVTSSVLGVIAATQDNVSTQFDAIVSSINSGIDALIAEPITLALQTILMVQTPARALTGIQARLDAYANLIGPIITGDNAIAPEDAGNVFHGADLYVSSYVTGSILSVVNNQFETQIGALEAADFLLSQFEDVTNWRDLNFQSISQVDTGASYQQLQDAVALAAGFLVEISFTLLQERTLILDRDRAVIDVVAELYRSLDDERLNFFIQSNELSGSEILELPRGREIVYYV